MSFEFDRNLHLFNGAGAADESYHAILGARERFGAVLWLFGDSLFRGFALRRAPENWTPEMIASDPLWLLHSPASTINLLLRDGGFLSDPLVGGELIACYAGKLGFPERNKIPGVARRIASLAKKGHIRPGDTIAYLDAGLHMENPDLYEKEWASLREAAVSQADVRLVICTTFENLSVMRDEMIGPFRRTNMMYDEPFPSSSGPRSLNDAIRAAALEMKAYRGETILLDAAELMRNWHAHLSDAFGISAYLEDQIHLNVWGQMKLVGALLATAWPGVELSFTSIERMVAESWKRLGYASSNEHWSADAAVDQLRCALIANDSQRYCVSAG